MAITDIGHSAYGVNDIDASIAFYALLGIKEAFRLHRADGSLGLVYLHVAGDRFIEIFPGGPSAALRAEGSTVSYRHLCLLSDDIVADVENLRSKGVTIDVEPKVGGDSNTQAWIADPDGNKIELMQIADESPQRAVEQGREPVIPTL